MAYEALYTRGRPKNFSQLVGQEHISNALTRAINSDRLSHAYLLVGTRGTGKTSTARLLAKAMNCDTVHEAQTSAKNLSAEKIPCNKCASCLSIDSSPDNVEFDAASNRSVEDVTRLLSTAHLAPLRSRVKTFIIDEVHMLSFEAVNSILKLIEEPPPNVAFFLATTELQKVPMTIRSRCQVLNFRLIPQETIAKHLGKFAANLNIDLEEEAAKRIARLAEGSMRDALTYLDQCYSMADKKISLADVNETLGLISDADLDKIIVAVHDKNRAEVGRTLNHAFRSGLTSISIAESLITRARDLEFKILGSEKEIELHFLENFVDELRKTTLEMQGSGVPDIILEMALIKFSAPKIVFAQPAEVRTVEISAPVVSSEKIQLPEQNSEQKPEEKTVEQKPESAEKIDEKPVEQNSESAEKVEEKPSEQNSESAEKIEKKSPHDENLDEKGKILYDTIDRFQEKDRALYTAVKDARVEEFTGDRVTLSFASDIWRDLFLDIYIKDFEKLLSEEYHRKITVKAILEGEFSGKTGKKQSTAKEENLLQALNIFQAADFQKITDEE